MNTICPNGIEKIFFVAIETCENCNQYDKLKGNRRILIILQCPLLYNSD